MLRLITKSRELNVSILLINFNPSAVEKSTSVMAARFTRMEREGQVTNEAERRVQHSILNVDKEILIDGSVTLYRGKRFPMLPTSNPDKPFISPINNWKLKIQNLASAFGRSKKCGNFSFISRESICPGITILVEQLRSNIGEDFAEKSPWSI